MPPQDGTESISSLKRIIAPSTGAGATPLILP